LARAQQRTFALQETKLKDEDFPADAFLDRGYTATFSGQAAYNGVAILSRQPADAVTLDIGNGYADEQKRVLGATFGPLRFWNLYVPNGQSVASDKYTSSSGSRRCAPFERSWRAIRNHCWSATISNQDRAPQSRGVARQDHVLAGRARGARGHLQPGSPRHLQAVPAARKDLQLVGLPRRSVSPQPRR
jgi:hypothetical protein